MFRSIALKLTLAFVLVSLAGIVMMGWLVQTRTENQIQQLNNRNQVASFVNFAEDWYVDNGSWDNFRLSPRGEQGNSNRRFGRDVVLTDEQYTIIFGEIGPNDPGDKLQQSVRQRAQPIEINNETVGYVVSKRDQSNSPTVQALGAAEQIFLNQFRRAVWLGSGVAILIALLVGAFLAGTLSRPLRKLTTATQALADGNLGEQVDIRSNDEIGNLAQAFNKMSNDLALGEQQRKQMTADIAHDLRTPLSVILGYTEALSEGKFEGDAEVYEAMHTEAQHLNRLIDDLRTLSLADAGKLSLQKTNVQASEILHQAHMAWRVGASNRNIELVTHLPNDFEVVVDPGRMGQILSNLVSNSIRYTPAGGTISISALQDGPSAVFNVADTGNGIPADQLPHIFDRFYRVNAARETAQGQSGLGLTIVKSLVEAHGGTISATSEVGAGTTFTIRLA